MALTKVTGQVVNTSTDLTVGVLTATTATFTGNVSVGGTLTYEDVTNVDSVGLITARNGISVTGSNISVESSEDRLLYLKSTDANAYLTFEDTDSSSGFANRIGSVSDGLYFSTGGGGERARIDSSGRLLLGTTTEGNSGADDLTIATSGNTGITIRSGTSDYGNIYYSDATSGTGEYAGYVSYQHSTNSLQFATASTERARIDSSGNFGLGTTSAGALLHIESNSADAAKLRLGFDSTRYYDIFRKSSDGSGDLYFYGSQSGYNGFVFDTVDGERMRIDSSGRLLVGTTSATKNADRLSGNALALVDVGASNYPSVVVTGYANANADAAPIIEMQKSRGASDGSMTVVANNDRLGSFNFLGSDGTNFIRAAEIKGQVDGTPGTNDMPGRLVFATSADGSASPTERMRINSNGFTKFTNTGSYVQGGEFSYHEFLHNINGLGLVLTCTNASYTSDVLYVQASRTGSSAYNLATFRSNLGADIEFKLRGDGNAYADGSWNGGGADYAEFFEWSDGNANAEDRRGISVVLDGDKIREAVTGEEPIGVISGNPSVVGDADIDRWKGKYLRDDYGTYIQEDYEVEDDDGNTIVQQRRKLNPDHNPDLEYIPRENRPEWDCVGLMGKIRIRKGQITGSRWIKMRDVSDTVEEWLVR